MLKLETAQAGSARCPHCGRVMDFGELDESGQTVEVLSQEDDLADEFLTKARLALKKKLLVVCGACHQRLTIEQRLGGKVVRCVACGGQIRVPGMGQDEPQVDQPSTQSPQEQEEEPRNQADGQVSAAEEPVAASGRAPARATGKNKRHVAPAPSRRGSHGKRNILAVVGCAVLLAGAAVTVLLILDEPQPAEPVVQEPPPKVAAGPNPTPRESHSTPAQSTPSVWETPPAPAPPTPTFMGLESPSPGGVASGSPPAADTQPKPKPKPPPTNGRVSIASADMSFLENGLPPAVGRQTYLELEVVFSPADGEVRIAPESMQVQAGQQPCKLAALGASGAGQKLLPPSALVVPAGQAFRQRLVFLVPEDFSAGKLTVVGAGEAQVSSPRRFVPPPGLEGRFVESQRFLRVGFDQPLLEKIRRGDRGQLLLRRAGDGVRVDLPELGLGGQATPVPEGGWSLALGDGQGQLTCRLRLVEPDRLVLYLSDRPYHQIVYERR